MNSQATYIARYNAILDRITADPACHTQASWHCGTAHCFAGHAQIDSGKEADDDTAGKDARAWLGLTSIAPVHYLFSPDRTLADFETYRDGFDLNGFDLNGYDREGYDCDGFDFSGYDCTCYDYNGYDSNGYDREGYDREGYNEDGLNAQLESRPE